MTVSVATRIVTWLRFLLPQVTPTSNASSETRSALVHTYSACSVRDVPPRAQ